jgi:sec-independent protein translocase protein TatA
MRIGPLGIWELLIILVVVLLIFGPRRLPEMAKGIGQSVREFRKGIRDMKDDFEAGSKDDQSANRKPAASASERSPVASAGEPAESKPADDGAAEPKADAKPVETKSA